MAQEAELRSWRFRAALPRSQRGAFDGTLQEARFNISASMMAVRTSLFMAMPFEEHRLTERLKLEAASLG